MQMGIAAIYPVWGAAQKPCGSTSADEVGEPKKKCQKRRGHTMPCPQATKKKPGTRHHGGNRVLNIKKKRCKGTVKKANKQASPPWRGCKAKITIKQKNTGNIK